jgi:hypothetical protein
MSYTVVYVEMRRLQLGLPIENQERAPFMKKHGIERNCLRRDCIAAILSAYVSYAGETPAVQIQIPISLNYGGLGLA